jgi:hypothetical protein
MVRRTAVGEIMFNTTGPDKRRVAQNRAGGDSEGKAPSRKFRASGTLVTSEISGPASKADAGPSEIYGK